MNYDDEYEDDELFIEDEPRSTQRTGFCGAIAEAMKRPERKIFPSMDDLLDE